MATDRRARKKTPAKTVARRADPILLRSRTDPRSERRFEAKVTPKALASVIALSVGAVAAGAGTYGRWMRGEALGPHPYAMYLLAGGVLLVVVVALFGQRTTAAARVGDAGVGLEAGPSHVERIPWYDIKSIQLGNGLLTFTASGTVVSLDLAAHGAAASAALAQAHDRIPDRVPSGLRVAPSADAGEVVELEPPQVAGMHCRSSDKLIAFDKDARLCGRCGQHYHKNGVPPRCLVCEAKLR